MIEAGLGGRYDATNVIPSTGAGADAASGSSTRAGSGRRSPTSPREKLDVVQPGATLVLGHGLAPRRASVVAERSPRERGARIVHAGADPGVERRRPRRLPAAQLRARSSRGRGVPRRARPGGGRRAAAARCGCPAASRSSTSEPLTLLDGAHNPDGMAALAESLPEIVAGAEPRRRGRLDPRRQGRRRDAARRCCRSCDATRPHQQSESPRVAAADAAIARRPARGSAVGDGPRSRTRRCAGRASSPAPGGVVSRHRLDLPGRRPAGPGRAPTGPRCCERPRRSTQAS